MIGCPPDIIFHSKRWLADRTKTVQECLITHNPSQKNILSRLGRELLLKTLAVSEAKTLDYELVSRLVSYICVLFRTRLKGGIEFPKQCFGILWSLAHTAWCLFCLILRSLNMAKCIQSILSNKYRLHLIWKPCPSKDKFVFGIAC
jgi:hypothetical protein